MDSNPDEPKYLLQYGYAQKKSDPSRFREIALQVVDKFPTSQSAAQPLYYIAGKPRAPSVASSTSVCARTIPLIGSTNRRLRCTACTPS